MKSPKCKMDVNTISSRKEYTASNLYPEDRDTPKCKSSRERLYRQVTAPLHLPCQKEHKGNFITHRKHINMTEPQDLRATKQSVREWQRIFFHFHPTSRMHNAHNALYGPQSCGFCSSATCAAMRFFLQNLLYAFFRIG